MTEDIFKKWVEIARWAPSGGNAQPWKLEKVESDSKLIFCLSIDPLYRKNPSCLDFDGAPSVIALGAFFESLCLVAELDRVQLDILRVNESLHMLDWSVQFGLSPLPEGGKASGVISSSETVLRRATNRFSYLNQDVPKDFRDWMCLDSRHLGFGLKFFDDANDQNLLIEVLSSLEKIRWEHPVFLGHVLDELKEIQVEGDPRGIPFSQLPLLWNEVFLIRVLKRWPWLRKLMSLGVSKQIAKSAIKVPIQNAPSFFYLYPQTELKEISGKDFFELGRSIQRIWLAAEERGLALQPLAGHLMPYQVLKNPAAFQLSPRDERLMHVVANRFTEHWGIDLTGPLFGFRMGYPAQAAPTSFRKEVNEILPSTKAVLAS